MFASRGFRGTHSMFRFACAASVLLSLLCLHPLADAWFHRDDFWLLALSRYTQNPIDFWAYDHSAFYFFRPLAMTVWWYSVAVLGVDPPLHNALNALLHVVVAISFGLWMRAFARSSSIGALPLRARCSSVDWTRFARMIGMRVLTLHTCVAKGLFTHSCSRIRGAHFATNSLRSPTSTRCARTTPPYGSMRPKFNGCAALY